MKYIIGLVVIIGIGFWYFSGMSPMMHNVLVDKGGDLTELPAHVVSEVKPTEVIELKDGDTFALEATIVSQEVGNRTVKRLAYNGQIPGPVLKVQKGSKVTVNFTNSIDMETALHSHGLRGNWKFDGAVPITPAVAVGETFAYELEFPDTGVFWYHPHVREDYQQEMGLYGNMIVEEEGYWNDVDQEEYLIIDDILEGGDFYDEMVTNTLMGRFGDKLLINDQEDYNLTVKAGKITRAYVTNVANTRTFKLEFEGAITKLVGGDVGRVEKEEIIDEQIIGTAERYVFELYYETPGTYSITHRGETMGMVTVEDSTVNRKADFLTLRTNDSDYADIKSNITSLLAQEPDKNLRLDIEMKGMMGDMMNDHFDVRSSDNEMVTLMGVEMTYEGAVEHCRSMPGMMGCELYLEVDNHEHNHDSENHMGEMIGDMDDMMNEEDDHGSGGIEWEDDMTVMNDMSNDETIEWIIEDADTKARNGEIDWSFEQGDLVKVRIYNDENGMHPMHHPIHFHGQRFVVLTEGGEVNKNLQWKDTVLIPKGETVDLLVDMSNPGKWMTHCHIAEHLHSGMMFNFDVK